MMNLASMGLLPALAALFVGCNLADKEYQNLRARGYLEAPAEGHLDSAPTHADKPTHGDGVVEPEWFRNFKFEKEPGGLSTVWVVSRIQMPGEQVQRVEGSITGVETSLAGGMSMRFTEGEFTGQIMEYDRSRKVALLLESGMTIEAVETALSAVGFPITKVSPGELHIGGHRYLFVEGKLSKVGSR